MFKAILKTVKQEKTKSSLSEQQDIAQIPKIEEKQCQTNFNRQILEYLPYQVPNSIEAIFYIKEILTLQQQEYLMNEIYNQPKRWVDLLHSNRRVQKYGGDVKDEGLINVELLPDFLSQLSVQIDFRLLEFMLLDDNTLKINHALINEYAPGIGIHPHFDGPLYHNFHLHFQIQKEDQSLKLFVEPGSLLIFTKQAYTEWLHGINYHHDDTILMNIKYNQVCNTDLINFPQTSLYQNLQNQPNYELCQIQNDNQFTHSLIIRRLLRVSITLRHVPYKRI